MEEHEDRTVNNDEIDLFELVEKLWAEKMSIVLITLISICVSGVYLLLAKPEYKASSYILPAHDSDISALSKLNQYKILPGDYTTAGINAQGYERLLSRDLRKRFFLTEVPDLYNKMRQSHPELIDDLLFEEYFYPLFEVERKDKKNPTGLITVSFTSDEASQASHVLNLYIEFVSREFTNEIASTIESYKLNRLESYRKEIASKRKYAKIKRADRIKKLKEAKIIALDAGIVTAGIDQAANQLNMEYMRGSKAIESELKVLSQRQNDESFIAGLRAIQAKKESLDSIKVDAKQLKLIRVDQNSYPPIKPEKPKKSLIIGLSVLLGIFVGMVFVLFRSAIRERYALENT